MNEFQLCMFEFVHQTTSEDVFVGVWRTRHHNLQRFDDNFTFILLFTTKNFFEGVLLMELHDIQSRVTCKWSECLHYKEVIDEVEV